MIRHTYCKDILSARSTWYD